MRVERDPPRNSAQGWLTLCGRDTSSDSAEGSRTYELLLDGRLVGTLARGEIVAFDVEPGDHSLAIKRFEMDSSLSSVRFTAFADAFFDEQSTFFCRGEVLCGPIRIQSHSRKTSRQLPPAHT